MTERQKGEKGHPSTGAVEKPLPGTGLPCRSRGALGLVRQKSDPYYWKGSFLWCAEEAGGSRGNQGAGDKMRA